MSENILLGKERRAEQLKAFERLLDVLDELRVKCPWDRKQGPPAYSFGLRQ